MVVSSNYKYCTRRVTTVNLRFPERRLFFLENSDVFNDFGIPPMRPFFSRKIGLDDEGNTIPILYGARLSGNLNKNLRMSLMNTQTKSEELPGNNYTSLAVRQRVFQRSIIKGYFHNRQLMTHEPLLRDDYNSVGGLEFGYRSQNGNWQGSGGYGMAFPKIRTIKIIFIVPLQDLMVSHLISMPMSQAWEMIIKMILVLSRAKIITMHSRIPLMLLDLITFIQELAILFILITLCLINMG